MYKLYKIPVTYLSILPIAICVQKVYNIDTVREMISASGHFPKLEKIRVQVPSSSACSLIGRTKDFTGSIPVSLTKKNLKNT
jgi:hypothetical protein